MKIKKSYVILGIILLSYCLLLFLYINRPGINGKTDLYLAKNGKEYLRLQNKKWTLNFADAETEPRNYDLYIDEKYVDNMKFAASDRWYMFKNGNSYQYDLSANFIGINSNQDVKIISSAESTDLNEDDIAIINKALGDINSIYSYNDIDYYTSLAKVKADFDNDEEEETLYYLSNTFGEEYNNFFTLVFFVDNDKIEYVTRDTASGIYDLCAPRYNATININNGRKNHVILTCRYFSLKGSCSYIVTAHNGSYKTEEVC